MEVDSAEKKSNKKGNGKKGKGQQANTTEKSKGPCDICGRKNHGVADCFYNSKVYPDGPPKKMKKGGEKKKENKSDFKKTKKIRNVEPSESDGSSESESEVETPKASSSKKKSNRA
jgi:hypothetical protein